MEKKYKKHIAYYKGFTYRIEEDLPDVGWYLYRDDENGDNTHDYLQDNLEIAVSFAESEFGIPKENWDEETL